MVTSTSHVAPPVQAPAPTAVHTPASQPKPQPLAVKSDTVQISAAAQALQEVSESPAQTAKEATGGDLQAKRLLAKEATEKAQSQRHSI